MWSYVGPTVSSALAWLWRSRETTNFTYDLTGLNREHLAWFVSDVASIPVSDARGYLAEVLNDWELREHVARISAVAHDRGVSDAVARYGRRIGWYALVRATKPETVVETGTDKGLGTLVLAAAVLRNGSGRVVSIDVDPSAGSLIAAPYDGVVDLVTARSIDYLSGFDGTVDLFLHDSDHAPSYEAAEFEAVTGCLSPSALVLSDNATVTNALPAWAEKNGRRFMFFGERPHGHWYAGAGIGVAI